MIAAVAALAAFRASSNPKIVSALIFRLCVSIRAMAASTASLGDMSFRRIFAANAVAVSVVRDLLRLPCLLLLLSLKAEKTPLLRGLRHHRANGISRSRQPI